MDHDLSYWTRRKLSRRRVTTSAGIAGAGLAGLALVGCGDDDDDSPSSTAAPSGSPAASASASGSPAAATPKKGGELQLSLGVPTSQTLDPHKTLNLGFSYYGLFLNRLIAAQRQTITPMQGELVQSWEQPDKSTYTFKVRPGVTWHDGKTGGGRAFTADDVAFNLMRQSGKSDPTRIALYGRATNFTGMDKAEAVDATTVKITFTSPNSAFLAGVADWRNWVIAKEHVDKDPDFKDIKNFAGTGPFMIDSWDQTTLAGKYVANPKYWRAPFPYLAGVQQTSLSDQAAIQAAFFSGKIDNLASISQEVRADITKNKADAKFNDYENLQWDYFGFNQTKGSFTDARVRQAIFKAIDYQSLLEQEYGKDRYSYTSVLLSGLPGAPSAADAAKSAPWDPSQKAAQITEAKKLMEQAGFPDGKISFKLLPSGATGSSYNHALRMQDQLLKVWPGMKIEFAVPADGAAFASDLAKGNYDFVAYTAAPPPDAIFDPAQRLRTGGSRNYTKFSDPQMDTMIDAIFSEFDAAARAKKLDELRARMIDSIINIPIGKLKQSFAVQKRIQGLPEYASGPGSSLYSYEMVHAAEQIWIS